MAVILHYLDNVKTKPLLLTRGDQGKYVYLDLLLIHYRST